MNTITALDEYVTDTELAQQLGRTARTLRTWRRQRLGPPFVVIGRDVKYRKDAVAEWLRSREQNPVMENTRSSGRSKNARAKR